MGLYRRIDISNLTGKDRAQVTKAVKSGRFVMSGINNDFIDDKNPRNKILIDSWLAQKKAKESSPQVDTVKKTVRKSTAKKKPAARKTKIFNPDAFAEPTNMAERKLAAEVAYKEEQALNWKLRNEREKGKSIPTDLVNGIVKLLGHSFLSNYKNTSLNILTEVQHKTKMSMEDFAKFKGKMFDEINKTHRNSINLAIKEINSAIQNSGSDDDENEDE